ncbi:hypothetical protein R1flu_026853 [Riccia fluitans]|uniref:OTU domain-containing protein n=1 Tax=Riccia fluitans TaxID=41844 RepID=A0ABD1XH68_9MARC
MLSVKAVNLTRKEKPSTFDDINSRSEGVTGIETSGSQFSLSIPINVAKVSDTDGFSIFSLSNASRAECYEFERETDIHDSSRRKRANTTTKTKSRGGGGDNGKMNEQLAPLGLKVVNITGDGNCFFRAVADQLEGNEEEHAKYRRMVVDYLEEHKLEFEPFLEEETPFHEYCNNMREDGTWAGHMELQAMSLASKCNICIHRIMFPRWQILNFQNPGTPILQLSYHGEEHYNSVRPIDDDGAGPPKLETIKAATKMVNEPPPAKDGKKQGTKTEEKGTASVKLVMAGSGCTDTAYIKQVLNEVHGDTSAAIEFIIAEKNFSEEIYQSAKDVPEALSNGEVEESGVNNDASVYESDIETINLLIKEVEAIADEESKTKPSTSKKPETGRTRPVVSRNKACPCGSKKKYKTCCGAIHHKPSVTVLPGGPEASLSNRARKDRSRAAKAAAAQPGESSSDRSSYGKEVDLGVLCI